MKRAAVAVVVAALLPAVVAPAAKPKAYTCGAVSATVLTWPRGHKAIRSVHFPAASTPNIQIYRIDPRFAGGNFLLYADVKGNVHTVPDYCVKRPSVASGAIASPRTVTGKQAVTCNEGATQTWEVKRTATGVKLLGHVGSKTLWTATVTRGHKAKITFDSSLCQLGPYPP